jgi:hypothetical protein
MDTRDDLTRNEGGLMSLAALTAALLIGGLTATLPKGAMSASRPSPSRRVDISLSMPQIAQSYAGADRGRPSELRTLDGPGAKVTKITNPAKLPPSTPGGARTRTAGRWE